MDEETYLKQRLGLDDREAKLLEKRISKFLFSLHDKPLESAQHLYENLLIQLLNYQSDLECHPPIQAANTKDITEYNSMVDRTAIIQSNTVTDIESLKEDLKKAKKSRDHKLEYDRVAREIMKLNTRDKYNESISNLERDISLLEREKNNKLKAFENRKESLSQLVQNLKNLQSSVEEERNLKTDDQKALVEMTKGYVSSDDEGDIAESSDEEADSTKEAPGSTKEAPAVTNHRFQERDEDEEDEEGIIVEDNTNKNSSNN